MRASPERAVVIGASAGAVEALSALLRGLPASYALPIVIVVHIPSDKKSALVELFKRWCAIEVREAEDKEPIGPAMIYFAPPDYHLLIEVDRSLSLSSDEPVLFSRPSIDVLFESAADAYGASLVAIVLTGANNDGAKGLRAVIDAGGEAIIQDPATAFASAMPMAAMAECPDARILSLSEIALYLRDLGRT
jgi:two-component system chemotaxis response regulator CheB